MISEKESTGREDKGQEGEGREGGHGREKKTQFNGTRKGRGLFVGRVVLTENGREKIIEKLMTAVGKKGTTGENK